MDTFTKKRYATFNYPNRYAGMPYYYDTKTQQDVFGIVKPMIKNVAWFAHKIIQGDTLDSLALKYYNNPTLWWVIAYFNDIVDPFIVLREHYDIIKIPSISSISFGDLR